MFVIVTTCGNYNVFYLLNIYFIDDLRAGKVLLSLEFVSEKHSRKKSYINIFNKYK